MPNKFQIVAVAGRAEVDPRTARSIAAQIAAGEPPPGVRVALELLRCGLLDAETGSFTSAAK
ncbi:MAG TPA: hypothetical protein VGM44_07015 [Polyangiaceae bacterium]|jgi:hypothetical protein